MIDSAKAENFDISVVIPALNAEDHLSLLLRNIEAQTLLPKEIVIVDSSPSNRTEEIIKVWGGAIPIIHKRVDFAFPGHARNIGVKLAKGEWIAFLDCRTLPDNDWLATSASVAEQSGAEFVRALCVSNADTHFKQILRAATYGHDTWTALPGSIVLKRVFEESGGFVPNVRAGEDLEWMHRLQSSDVKFVNANSPTIKYHGLSEFLSEAIAKWYTYAKANADIEVRNNHKKIYLAIFVFLMFLLIYNWNAMFAPGNDGGSYYVPNITKIFVTLLLALCVVYRGIIRPLQVGVTLSFLLPWRWLEIAFVGLCLDLAKAPGLIWGAIQLLKRRIARN